MKCLELPIPALPQLVMAGHTVWPPETKHFERRFDLYDVVFVKSGTLYMTEDGVPYEVRSGEVLVLEPGLMHYGHKASGEQTEIFWFHFVHSPRARVVDNRDIPWKTVLQQGTSLDVKPPSHVMILPKHAQTDFKLYESLLERLVELQQLLTLEHSLEIHLLTIQIFSLLQYSVCRQLAPQTRAISEKAIDYLKLTMREPFSAKHMERELHFDYDYISRCFKKYTGMTPAKYVQHLRIEEAKALLHRTDLPLADIGERIGIRDVNYFVRLFKELTGTTPIRYRVSGRGYV
ncbi:helix-turn-helix domain-containing protein [Paenibacillus hemerocallicola]|jgi:AraC-like DNA-binding protein|uniref:Helix-turn-helix domain-containing protein n=1 Tax=Paenibacillus hemerocallicola TaxID=1172614 RepID=A0A5C4SVX5_9BACL|nr:AraC family transcriptional regulator [Paenibacillus hemerocallicola]TNJ55054.1 helix-turn-helix domain-containing protein [Paenibacillus hemerocallicola]